MNLPIIIAILFRLYLKPGYSARLLELVETAVERAAQIPADLLALKLMLQMHRYCFLPAGTVFSIPVRAADALGYLYMLADDRSKKFALRCAAFSLLAAAAGEDKTLLVELAARFQAGQEEPALRRFAYEMIRQRQGRMHSYGPSLLRQLAAESDPDLAAQLLELVYLADPALLPSPGENRQYWVALLNFPHQRLFETALRLLGRFGAAATTYAGLLSERLAQETEPLIKQLLIDTLARVITTQSEAVVPIGFCLRERNVHVSIAAYQALLSLGPKAAAVMPLLTLEMLAKAESRRQRALDLMAAIGTAAQEQAAPDAGAVINFLMLQSLASVHLSSPNRTSGRLALIWAAAARLELFQTGCLGLQRFSPLHPACAG